MYRRCDPDVAQKKYFNEILTKTRQIRGNQPNAALGSSLISMARRRAAAPTTGHLPTRPATQISDDLSADGSECRSPPAQRQRIDPTFSFEEAPTPNPAQYAPAAAGEAAPASFPPLDEGAGIEALLQRFKLVAGSYLPDDVKNFKAESVRGAWATHLDSNGIAVAVQQSVLTRARSGYGPLDRL